MGQYEDSIRATYDPHPEPEEYVDDGIPREPILVYSSGLVLIDGEWVLPQEKESPAPGL